MTNRPSPEFKFQVTPVWDEAAQVFYSRSYIPGLHIETKTMAEFLAETDAVVRMLLDEKKP